MYKNVLRSISEIDFLANIGLVIFFTFFALIIYWVIKRKDSFVEDMSKMPLDD